MKIGILTYYGVMECTIMEPYCRPMHLGKYY